MAVGSSVATSDTGRHQYSGVSGTDRRGLRAVQVWDEPGRLTMRWRPVSRRTPDDLRADPRRKTKMKTALLKLEQLALDVETAAVTAKRPARRNHPVAGDNDGDWIPV